VRLPTSLTDEALQQLIAQANKRLDIPAHNEAARALWEAYEQGTPERVPLRLGINGRFILLDPALNPEKVTFYEYTTDPELMLAIQLRFQCWVRHAIVQDADLGLPEGWGVAPDLQNYYEGAWLGCPLFFHDGEVPDCRSWLHDDNKRAIFERGIPDPFGGALARNLEYYEYFKRRKEEGFEFMGRPLTGVGLAANGTDGTFTTACQLRGATEICLDLYEDPQYVHELLTFITEAAIVRIKAYRQFLGQPLSTQSWGIADDSIELLSVEAYREFVLPHHRRLLDTFGEGGPHSIHLCGDAQRHFPILQQELNIQSFDTGFPIDFGWVRRVLGPEVWIQGGPSIQLLLLGTPDEVTEETRRILASGVTEGKRFMLREGNNLAPRTPLANLDAFYQAALTFGRYA